MKKVIITIVMFAIAVALIVGVILPIANHGRETGTEVEGHLDTIDAGMGSLAEAIR